MKPIIDGLPGRDSFIFQPDGARCHTTTLVLAWLLEEFDGSVILGNTDTPYPARSPDLTLAVGCYSGRTAQNEAHCHPAAAEHRPGLSIYYVSSYNKAGIVRMLMNAYLREQGFIQKLMSYENPH